MLDVLMERELHGRWLTDSTFGSIIQWFGVGNGTYLQFLSPTCESSGVS